MSQHKLGRCIAQASFQQGILLSNIHCKFVRLGVIDCGRVVGVHILKEVDLSRAAKCLGCALDHLYWYVASAHTP